MSTACATAIAASPTAIDTSPCFAHHSVPTISTLTTWKMSASPLTHS